MKNLLLHTLSAVSLVGFIEFYVWTQSRSAFDDSSLTKAFLAICYFVLAVGSEYLADRPTGYELQRALTMNLVVAALISAWLTFSAFVFHPGLAKERQLDVVSAATVFLRFLMSVGAITFVLRFGSALISRRWSVVR